MSSAARSSLRERWRRRPLPSPIRGPIARGRPPRAVRPGVRICWATSGASSRATCGRRPRRGDRGRPREASARAPGGAAAGSGCGTLRRELRELVAFMGLRDVLVLDRMRAGAGSPKSGKSVSVSRKNVNSAIRPSRARAPEAPTARTRRPALGLYWPNAGEPFAVAHGQHPRPPAADPGAEPPRRGCRRGRSATGRTAASTASRPPGSAR